jgi:uncharacterized membrane protein
VPIIAWASAAAAVFWAVALPASAAAQSQADAGSLWRGFSVVAYTVGRFICHQRPERSFHLWSVPLPVCARCVGIYAAAALVGMVYLTWRSNPANLAKPVNLSNPSARRARMILAVGALPTIATLVYEWTSGTVPNNWARALAGVPLGAAAAVIIMVSLLRGRLKP